MRAFVCLGLAVALLAGCASTGHPPCVEAPAGVVSAAAEADSSIASYRLGPGDRLRLTVFRQPDLSGQFALDGEGRLALPLVGEIPANGLTVRRLEAAIAQRFLEENLLIEPRVAIEVLTFRPFYVLGEVRRPGEYPYQDGMNVMNAVALAGGFTYRAKTSGMAVVRDGCSYDAAPDALLQPGEILMVPERFF
jgi:protein involved in polysaccharide export with SLBB domain